MKPLTLAEAIRRDLEPRDAIEARLPPFARLLRRAELARRRRDAESHQRALDDLFGRPRDDR